MLKSKKGDTLIEVTLAIGIFSMVAIAVASVMNGGVSDAQTSLETTLAREQIDSQAEALRFIHSSYISYTSFKNESNPYVKLWNAIKSNAINNEAGTDISSVTDFAPTSCDNLYNSASENNIFSQNAFIVNLNSLSDLMTAINNNYNVDNAIDNTIIRSSNQKNKFIAASTYPRVVYGRDTADNTDKLISHPSSPNLYSAEGIYIVAVKDSGTTTIVNNSGGANSDASAFYDFYIRTCWYGASGSPSTISTVIRLNDIGV